MRGLGPAHQRIYELLSFPIYGALKWGKPYAGQLYSELCLASPLTRYYQWEKVKKQLYKLHRPHLASGYLAAVEYEIVRAADGEPDWLIKYTPGPKAKEEFIEFSEQKSGQKAARARLVAAKRTPAVKRTPVEAPPASPVVWAGEEAATAPLAAQLKEQGISERKANELAHKYPERIAAQLDSLSHRNLDGVPNVTGWLIRAIEEDYALPQPMLKAQAQARAKQAVQRAADLERAKNDFLERHQAAYVTSYLVPQWEKIKALHPKTAAYVEKKAAEVDRWLENLSEEQRQTIKHADLEEIVQADPQINIAGFWEWARAQVAEPIPS